MKGEERKLTLLKRRTVTQWRRKQNRAEHVLQSTVEMEERKTETNGMKWNNY